MLSKIKKINERFVSLQLNINELISENKCLEEKLEHVIL